MAVTHAIALMLQRSSRHYDASTKTFHVEVIAEDAFEEAVTCLEEKHHKAEMKTYMSATSVSALKLAEPHAIGYTLKALGAGFWALRQNNFREAITEITMQVG